MRANDWHDWHGFEFGWVITEELVIFREPHARRASPERLTLENCGLKVYFCMISPCVDYFQTQFVAKFVAVIVVAVVEWLLVRELEMQILTLSWCYKKVLPRFDGESALKLLKLGHNLIEEIKNLNKCVCVWCSWNGDCSANCIDS